MSCSAASTSSSSVFESPTALFLKQRLHNRQSHIKQSINQFLNPPLQTWHSGDIQVWVSTWVMPEHAGKPTRSVFRPTVTRGCVRWSEEVSTRNNVLAQLLAALDRIVKQREVGIVCRFHKLLNRNLSTWETTDHPFYQTMFLCGFR